MKPSPTRPLFPPGPESRSPLGHLFAFARNPLGFLITIAAQYGDLVHFKIRKRDVFLVNHPEDIQGILVTHSQNFVKNPGFQTIKRLLGEGLLSSEGEFHLHQRRMIQPAFHRQRVASYGPQMVQEAIKLSSRWEQLTETEVFEDMVGLTLRVVSGAMFSADLETQTRQISQAVDAAMSLFHQATSPLALAASKIPGIGDRSFRRGRDRLDALVLDLIRQRRLSGEPRDDLLDRVVWAQDEAGGTPMTDQQVRDEVLTILLAGHETTAAGLAWAWYLLSQNPVAEAAFHAELDQVLHQRRPGVEDLSRLHYTRSVFAETLRLFPPIYMIGRQALKDYPVQDYVIPAGASIIISPYLVNTMITATTRIRSASIPPGRARKAAHSSINWRTCHLEQARAGALASPLRGRKRP